MKKLKEFDVNLVGLKDKKHEYDFVLDNGFFQIFEQNLVNGGQLTAHVEMDKSPLLLNFDITIKGVVNLTCDRSLENFDYPVDLNQNLLIKYGDEELELDENVLQITHNAQKINIAQHLFDYIGLAIPMKKLHPRFAADEAEEGDLLIYSTAPESGQAETEAGNEENNDPRWDILKNLSKN
ncbi:DNA-binding protein [Adhaeribacter aerolatus]|uniref:DNA-binding protein n=1 Tax=Adhaeribacter aerolatus TaxID=670289 RepID=A0A512AWJ3_9BACT|nr:DUF177 domain-containing protein [Adhaeribacter aerolatus]GEO04088.1 DNA-binding protein [Adhaeribacter aerolatus]